MHLWEPYVNLSFSKVSLGGDVRISFEQNGCWSYLAKTCESAAAGEPTMGLGCVKETLPMNDSEKRFILHELGHMLGMIHEHQSPATNGVLTFKRQGRYGKNDPIYMLTSHQLLCSTSRMCIISQKKTSSMMCFIFTR